MNPERVNDALNSLKLYSTMSVILDRTMVIRVMRTGHSEWKYFIGDSITGNFDEFITDYTFITLYHKGASIMDIELKCVKICQ